MQICKLRVHTCAEPYFWCQFTYIESASFCLRPFQHHKVHIEYHSVCLVGIGTHPPPLPQACVPPDQKGDGSHAPAGEGVGESQFRRLEEKLSTLSTNSPRLSISPFQSLNHYFKNDKNSPFDLFQGPSSSALGAGAFFGFLAMVLYGYDAFVKFRGWRAGQLAQGERKVTQQTATSGP